MGAFGDMVKAGFGISAKKEVDEVKEDRYAGMYSDKTQYAEANWNDLSDAIRNGMNAKDKYSVLGKMAVIEGADNFTEYGVSALPSLANAVSQYARGYDALKATYGDGADLDEHARRLAGSVIANNPDENGNMLGADTVMDLYDKVSATYADYDATAGYSDVIDVVRKDPSLALAVDAISVNSYRDISGVSEDSAKLIDKHIGDVAYNWTDTVQNSSDITTLGMHAGVQKYAETGADMWSSETTAMMNAVMSYASLSGNVTPTGYDPADEAAKKMLRDQVAETFNVSADELQTRYDAAVADLAEYKDGAAKVEQLQHTSGVPSSAIEDAQSQLYFAHPVAAYKDHKIDSEMLGIATDMPDLSGYTFDQSGDLRFDGETKAQPGDFVTCTRAGYFGDQAIGKMATALAVSEGVSKEDADTLGKAVADMSKLYSGTEEVEGIGKNIAIKGDMMANAEQAGVADKLQAAFDDVAGQYGVETNTLMRYFEQANDRHRAYMNEMFKDDRPLSEVVPADFTAAAIDPYGVGTDVNTPWKAEVELAQRDGFNKHADLYPSMKAPEAVDLEDYSEGGLHSQIWNNGINGYQNTHEGGIPATGGNTAFGRELPDVPAGDDAPAVDDGFGID